MKEVSVGEKFSNLTVLYRDTEYEDGLKLSGKSVRPYYRCKCQCGNETTVIVYNLLRGITKSCGCLKHQNGIKVGSNRKIDLAGMVFNKMLVMHRDANQDSGSGKHVYWICECQKCGTIRSIRSSDLLSGTVQDCGCGKTERSNNGQLNDIAGQIFGNLTVIKRDMANGKRSGRHARWLCKCGLCGAIESIDSSTLTRYGKDRCTKCMKTSVGEEIISELLTHAGIEFERNKSYLDCKFQDTGWALRFDFIVHNYDAYPVYMIEFDGIQHFRKIPIWENAINYDGRVARDTAKNDWCKEHCIPLIRIPYTHLKSICMNDLTPSTTEFLI